MYSLPKFPADRHNYTDALHRLIEIATPPQITQMKEVIIKYRKAYRKGARHNPLGTVLGILIAMDETMLKNKETINTNENPPVSCSAGCDFCCRLHVIISEDEGKLLLHTAKENNVTIDTERLQKQKGLSVAQWKKLSYSDRACVFLKNGLCSIYKSRPSSCRKYQVVTPAAFCDTDTFNGHEVGMLTDTKAELLTTVIHSESPTDLMANVLLKLN